MKHWIIIAFCMCFAGCTGYQHVEAPHYVPVNTEKGDFTTNFLFNSFQMGYAMSNHFSAFVAGRYRNNHGPLIKQSTFGKENNGEFTQTDMHKQLEFGFTYFKPLQSKFNFELVTWTGFGRVEYSNNQDVISDYDFSFNGQKMSFNIQPGVSIVFNDQIDLSFFSNFNYTRYYNMDGRLELGERSEIEKYDRYFYNRRVVPLAFWEPGIQFRAGWKNFKLLYSFSKNMDLLNTGIKYRKTSFYLGISLNFNILHD